tara:strand:- start:317 stop:727 length:411 start_codon:yes stop_codon:yes gene_type:complete
MVKDLTNKIFSLLASLLFPFTAVIGMLVGQIGSRLFSSAFSFTPGVFQIGGEFIFFTVSGYCAGYFSAFVVSKVYKNFNFKYALIIPVLLMVYFGYENILEASKVSLSFLINNIARDLVMLVVYYYLLEEYHQDNN